jgi:tRNA threonylcarbamoyl adenosine modification protein (Sua5/YciO/YrdC/YwlC family)
MAELLDWRTSTEPEAIVARAVEVLERGGLVAFPTETVYGIAASLFAAGAIERLVHCKGRPENKPLTLALGEPQEALEWAPGMSKLGRRLALRGWPGPLTLVFDHGLEGGRLSQLPQDVRQRVAPQGSLGLRVPAHEAILDVLSQLTTPLVLTSANRSGEPDALTGTQVHETLGSTVDLIIDGGPTRYGKPSSVIRVCQDRWEPLREGVMPASLIDSLTRCLVLFVCTGNTCRSPLAAGLCQKLLAERLVCTPGELPQRGFVVRSAGVSAMMGMSASAEAIETARERGVDLEGHVSQPLTPALLAQADYVFAMTEGHLGAIRLYFGGTSAHVELLSPAGEHIPDPIGGDRQAYEDCAARIEACLRERVPLLEA